MGRRHGPPVAGARPRLELDAGDGVVEEDGEPVSADLAHRRHRDRDGVAGLGVVDQTAAHAGLARARALAAVVPDVDELVRLDAHGQITCRWTSAAVPVSNRVPVLGAVEGS